MTDRPLVSVVTPSLNQARFLDRMLASLRAQTYPHIEHLVIDGGSTDGTLDILRREADLGRLQFISEPDGGMYDALNKGLARTSGEILCYLNGDDAWFPWTLATIVAAFNRRRDADLVFGDGIKVREDSGSQRLRLFGPFDGRSLASYESLMQPAVFWRRRLYERIGGFDAGMRYVADLDYWLRAGAAASTVVHVSEVIAIERIHEARLSSAHEAVMAAENREMRARHLGDRGTPERAAAARARAVDRDERWQRWLWLQFLAAFALRPAPAPWRRFIQAGRLTVDGGRVLLGIQAHKHQHLWGAVSSGLAATVLSGAAEPQRGPGWSPLERVGVLVAVGPRMPGARLAVSRRVRQVRRLVGRGLRIGGRMSARVTRPLEPVFAYRHEIRKPRRVPMVSRRSLARDFVPWWRSQGRSTLESRQPWITFQATRILARRLPPAARAFEYGSGGSTLWLAERAAQLVSVEHDPEWYEQVRAAVGARPSVELVLAPARPPVDDAELQAFASASADFVGQTFADYVRVVDRFPDHHFDLLVVDGRARPAAFFRAEPKVRVGGLVVLDDSERERYGAVVAAAKAAGWTVHGRYGPKAFTPWFARTTVWEKTQDLASAE